MKSGKQYDEVSKFFAAHKTEILDEGFSQRVMEFLPDRSYTSPLRSILVVLGALVTLAVVVLIGGDFIVDAAADLIYSVRTLSMPSSASLVVYGGLVVLLSTMGFAACYED